MEALSVRMLFAVVEVKDYGVILDWSMSTQNLAN